MTVPSPAILGFRPHTGWAAAVVLASGKLVPQIVDRRRIVYEPKATRFVYHSAAEDHAQHAEDFITTARAQTLEMALSVIRQLISELKAQGYSLAAAVVPAGNAKLPKALGEILRAHSRIHAAEGSFYRDVLADACEEAGLKVHRIPERDLWPNAASALKISETALRERIRELGTSAGPPWSEDQKLATLAAWPHLISPHHGRA